MKNSRSEIKYVTDDAGKTISVILDIEAYEAMLEMVEELDDIREYQRMKPLVDEDMQEGHFYTLEEVLMKYGKE